MSRIKLTKIQRELIEAIKQAGGKVIDLRRGKSHLLCDYELGKGLFFTATLPCGTSLSPRWIRNFQCQLRNNKGTKS